jgi:hypothetical protein
MSSSKDSAPDSKRSRLRVTLAAIEIELARLSGPANVLRSSVADLVEQLALGPEPEVRACPVCQRVVRRAATMCGHCWTKLTPPSGGSVSAL